MISEQAMKWVSFEQEVQKQQYCSIFPPAHCHCPTEPKQLAAKLCDNYQVILVPVLPTPESGLSWTHEKLLFYTNKPLCGDQL